MLVMLEDDVKHKSPEEMSKILKNDIRHKLLQIGYNSPNLTDVRLTN